MPHLLHALYLLSLIKIAIVDSLYTHKCAHISLLLGLFITKCSRDTGIGPKRFTRTPWTERTLWFVAGSLQRKPEGGSVIARFQSFRSSGMQLPGRKLPALEMPVMGCWLWPIDLILPPILLAS